MKKSLVLAMAMALGVTASAYAANPFSDVPAGHWAYDSISKLAAAGVVEGYPDGSFKGDNLMTRYEMAQIVAKAMAKGANVDALAAEFADELDNLGVRVAALEKKADNVKITGYARFNYAHNTDSDDAAKLRTRLWFAGQVNEDWTYTAMLQNDQSFKSDDVGDETTKFQRAYADGKLGGMKVRAGRFNWSSFNATNFTSHGSSIYETRVDGVNVSYGKAVKLQGFAGKFTDSAEKYDVWAGDISAKLGKAATLNVGYYNLNGDTAANKELLNVGLAANLGKNVVAGVDYLKVNSDDNAIDGNNGWIAALTYKGAKPAQVGSWGLSVKYQDIEEGCSIAEGWNGEPAPVIGEGYGIGAYYTVAKNMVAGVEYFNADQKADDGKHETLWSQLVFTF